MPVFSHLHTHTQFSLLDGAASIKSLYEKAVADKQPAIAITDHGNMFGVFNFMLEAAKFNKSNLTIKPIIGCEFYLAENRLQHKFVGGEKDKRYHQLLLAKDEEGYRNLSMLCSLGYIDGLYGKYPRIDKELVKQYSKGLIATTCCLGAIVPKTFKLKGEEAAEEEFKWWLDVFGEDYYIELQRHNLKDQDELNEVLLRFSKKYNVKVIATNDSHYTDKDDALAHDILLCVNTGEKLSTPKNNDYDDESGMSNKGKRFAFPNNEFYFKTQDEMNALFADIPQAIDNTNDIVGKIKSLDLKKDILLPNFQVPSPFTSQIEYLRHLTFEGARQKYSTIDEVVESRLNYELGIIEKMNFAGYFLIVSDFIKAGREMNVVIGPGRGSAAGSAVAYCTGITNIDPIKYDLLFERFLNPDRKSMPDIDTDFDDHGRQKVIDYVVEKYGRNQVAQIVTYGRMASKMSVKDVARVMDLPINESNALTKLIPSKPAGITLKEIFHSKIEGVQELNDNEDDDDEKDEKDEKDENSQDDVIKLKETDIPGVNKLREFFNDKNNQREGAVLRMAEKLEGSVRNTGVHAAGIIIAPTDLREVLPVALSKDYNLYLTQFEGKVVEDAGVIKMDFLGLKTLTIIRTALELIYENHKIAIDINNIPLDDKKTFELYQKGETIGTFQFESPGMQKYLRDLKVDKFEDLIAMNALYRPGPMDYIPKFIKRKLGIEPVTYELPEEEQYLSGTYGITIYQEQVMLLSQKLGGLSGGDADKLRKAMGKKDKKSLDVLKEKFFEGIKKNGLDEKICEKIWSDWEKFASYAFNKSHSTCYAYVAYQTAYLKANYPAEYMAAILTNNINNLDKISTMMEECKRMGIAVLGPDINESGIHFAVNKKGEIRFGLSAIKNVGGNPAQNIVEERQKNGPYKNIFDVAKRCNLRSVNKKTLESLVIAGAFQFDKTYHKAQYLQTIKENETGIDLILRFGANEQNNKNTMQNSLFGENSSIQLDEPKLNYVEPMSLLEECKLEKEMVGIFITKHPMDNFLVEYKALTNTKLTEFEDLNNLQKKHKIIIAGIVVGCETLVSKKGSQYMKFTLEDFYGQYSFYLNGKMYDQFKNLIYLEHFIYMEVVVEKNKYMSDRLDTNILLIEKMDTVREKRIKGIKLDITTDELSNDFLIRFNNLLGKHLGNDALYIHLKDLEKKNTVDLKSSNTKVNICNELIAELENLQIKFKILS